MSSFSVPTIDSITTMVAAAQDGKDLSSQRKIATETRLFVDWLDGRPPTAENAAEYIDGRFPPGAAHSSITVTKWALQAVFSFGHEACSCPNCTWNEALERSLDTSVGKSGKRKLTAEDVESMLYAIERDRRTSTKADVSGTRDACIISMLWSTGAKRSRLWKLDRSDVGPITDLTMQVNLGRGLSVSRGRSRGISALDPVERLVEWCDHVSDGALFREVNFSGSVQPGRLSDRSMARIVKTWAAATGKDPAHISTESLRAA